MIYSQRPINFKPTWTVLSAPVPKTVSVKLKKKKVIIIILFRFAEN